MIYGLCDRQQRVEPWPGGRASCPTCGGELLAKCGEIVAWHWAHRANDCDPWAEGESHWHYGWKLWAPPERREVVRGNHRADIVGPGGGVIELQHSSISPEEIREREAFYGKMIWVIDAAPFQKNLSIRNRGEYLSFRWYHPRKTLLAITKPLFFDFGDGDMLEVRKLGRETPLGGWGYYWSQVPFCLRYLGVAGGWPGRSQAGFLHHRGRNNPEWCHNCNAFGRRDPDGTTVDTRIKYFRDGKLVEVIEPRWWCFGCLEELEGSAA